jgi:hypothetical protein
MSNHRFRADSKAAFMCECGASLCDARVRLSVDDYDAAPTPVFAEGHGPDGAGGKCSSCGRPYRGKRRKRA